MDLMMWAFSMADADHYEPLERAEDWSPRYWPRAVPAGWIGSRRDVWRVWERPDRVVLEQGWKIHVSATLERAPQVLDAVAAACFAEDVTFKHLATEFTYLCTHHKHAGRPQAGKFCAIYPPDQAVTRRLLDLLADRLRDEDGPYILSDRRYRDSRTVHYRYGAFRVMSRARPDGTWQRLVRDGSGALVEDRRGVSFTPPAGVPDPFADPHPEPAAGRSADGGIHVGSYRVLAAVAHSNGGGAYRAVDQSGAPVFIKEARAHNGHFWDRTTAQQRLRREYRVLQELHERAPGLAPQPLAYFREWEHEFLVTELVPGRSLFDYVAQHNPFIQSSSRADVPAYFDTCRRFLDQLAAALHRLHGCGYRFGDVNPRNILVAEDNLRLVDFEACGKLDESPIDMGAPGYLPPQEWDRAGTAIDEYGLSAVALGMILPLHQAVERNPAVLDHLYAAARSHAAVPADVWRLATRNVAGGDRVRTRRGSGGCHPNPGEGCLPRPEELAADPIRHLNRLRDALGRHLAASAAPDDPDRVYPTVPRGYLTNTLCVAYGTAGVLHALHHASIPVDPQVVDRLRRQALDSREELPAGLHTGTAGVGWVLAELGNLDEAVELVEAAGSHPTAAVSGTWGTGMAGIGAARLALHAHTGDDHQRARAAAIGDTLCDTVDLTPLVGPRNAAGLLYGRAGMALFLYHLWRATGHLRYLRHGTTLLCVELDRAIELEGGELAFPDDDRSRRAMPYLAVGSAGVGHVLTRYVAADGDPRLAAALPRVFAGVDRRLAVEPGLYQGLAGLAFALADHADLAGPERPDLDHAGNGPPSGRASAVRVASGLFTHAVPAPGGGARFLGEHSLRFSTELWSGTAGILLALDRILRGPHGQFFTLDHLVPATAGAGTGVRGVRGWPQGSEPDRYRRGGDNHDGHPGSPGAPERQRAVR